MAAHKIVFVFKPPEMTLDSLRIQLDELDLPLQELFKAQWFTKTGISLQLMARGMEES